MLRFRKALDHLQVKEIPLAGRKFMWSNLQDDPTITHIDRAFCTPYWEQQFPHPTLFPLPSSTSDHCPLILSPLNMPKLPPKFRFEFYWPSMPGFKDYVQHAWDQPVPNNLNPMMRLHTKLSRMAKALIAWSRRLIPHGKLAMATARKVIRQLETAMEFRQLTLAETRLIKQLKKRLLGLAAVEKSRARQKSRITLLRKGDANTKYFQLMASIRTRKKFIHGLQTENGLATTQAQKQEVVYNHFLTHIGTNTTRSCTLNFQQLGWQPRNLQALELPFTKAEVEGVIIQVPKEMAPGSDGFIGLFFSTCWDIIRDDILIAINQFYNMNQQGLHFLNQAHVVLVPKKTDPTSITDYRPISLSHSFSKIISKLMANRLAPELENLISINQSAFIKRRSIHGNFVFVQEMIKELYRTKTPTLFIKLDISKVFDTVNWAYLLNIMAYLGFGQRWRTWMAALWCTASSTYLVNRECGKRVLHCKGVRQGDPLSPMIFLLAIEPLHRLFQKAQEEGLLAMISRSV